MTGKSRDTKHVPGTLDTIRPGESLDDYEKRVGDDIPELTEEFFRNAKPITEFPELYNAIMRARGQRGPQKTPTKERVSLRLDRDIVESYRAGGPGWQTRINNDLARLQKRKKHG
jgi:uncharacterized protein (DUF4415 family)